MRHVAALLAAIAVLTASCGTVQTESGGEASTSTPPGDAGGTTTVAGAPESIVATPATTTTTKQAPAGASGSFEVLHETDVVYHSDEDGEWTMEVYYPDAEGPWPLVVVYHGMGTAPANGTAQQIADRGAVAVAPRWLKAVPPTLTRETYIDGKLFDRAACAVGKAQEIAVDFDADPANTTVVVFSAGIHPTGWIGLGVVRNDLCQTALAYQPVGVVMGDSQFLFYEEGWDESFADSESPAADTTDRFVNPERWDVPNDLAVYLWTSDFRHGRDVDNLPATDSWIWVRDTTGTLLDDLAVLEAFEDEWIDFMDNGLLMKMRMNSAGIDVMHEAVGGGHNYSDAVYDGIEALIAGQ